MDKTKLYAVGTRHGRYELHTQDGKQICLFMDDNISTGYEYFDENKVSTLPSYSEDHPMFTDPNKPDVYCTVCHFSGPQSRFLDITTRIYECPKCDCFTQLIGVNEDDPEDQDMMDN